MTTVYMICAVAGGVTLLCQMALTLLGFDSDTDIDVSADVPDDLEMGDDYLDGDQSSIFFGLLSFRSLTAAFAFFGLGGLASLEFGVSPYPAMVIALACGAVAMFLVAWLMRLLINLNAEGNVRIENALGQIATVYLRIPGHREGIGKVTVTLQRRSEEFCALTQGETLPSGARAEVIGIVDSNTLEVKSVE